MNACSLLSVSQASSLAAQHYTGSSPTTIAPGQDQCSYSTSDDSDALTVIIYQSSSGVSWATLTAGSGATTSVGGIGDQAATDGAVELDVQSGTHLIAVQTGSETARVAVAKALVAALQ